MLVALGGVQDGDEGASEGDYIKGPSHSPPTFVDRNYGRVDHACAADNGIALNQGESPCFTW